MSRRRIPTDGERLASRVEDRIKLVDELAGQLHQLAGHVHLFRYCQEAPCYELRRELFAVLEDLDDSEDYY